MTNRLLFKVMRNILELKRECLSGMSNEKIKIYLNNSSFEWKDWYFDRVYSPNQLLDNLQFWKPSSEYVDYVQPRDVIGHNHGSISEEINWIALLSCPKRNRSDTDVSSVLQLLNEQDKLPIGSLIHLEKYGDLYFFSEGKHRMVQAKFLEVEKVRCLVSEFVFDEHAYHLFCRIQSKAKIKNDNNWSPDLPVNATVEEIPFIIPLEDKAVEVLEHSIMNAQRIARMPLYRRYYLLRNGVGDNTCQCFNLKFSQSPERIVSALVRRLIKAGK